MRVVRINGRIDRIARYQTFGLASVPATGGAHDDDSPVYALLARGPAIDAGNPAKPGSGKGACELTDQRGTPRAVCDIGA